MTSGGSRTVARDMAETIRIAVCDDARAVKMFFRHVLEEEGDIEVVSSTSTGRAVLDEMGRHRPDALLLGLVLPDVADPGVLVRRRRAEHDPLELGHGGAAEAQHGLEALGAELAGVERAPELVQRGAVLL